MKEFNLSEKIVESGDREEQPDYIDVPDVKEFIRRLKEEIVLKEQHIEIDCKDVLCEEIDKLSGKELLK